MNQFYAAIIRISDTGCKTERNQIDNQALVRALTDNGYEVKETIILPENSLILKTQLLRLADVKRFDLIYFINESANIFRNAVIEMSDGNIINNKGVTMSQRSGTILVYQDGVDTLKSVELCHMLKHLKNENFFKKLDMNHKVVHA